MEIERFDSELRQFLRDTMNEWNKNCTLDVDNPEFTYWQGRKDATRLIFALFRDCSGGVDTGLKEWIECSPNYRGFTKDA